MLKINDLIVTFNNNTPEQKKPLNGVNLEIGEGEFVCLLGANGSGKSTLFNSILGLVRPSSGQIILDGEDITKWSIAKRATKIGIVFQDHLKGTAPNLTIEENLLLASQTKTFFKRGFKRKFYEETKKALASFELNLENRLKERVGLLSGGERQALTLHMAVSANPKLLLLDEHTAALDPKTSVAIMEKTDQLVKEHNLSTLMITHNITSALKYGNRLLILKNGLIALDVSGAGKEKLKIEDILPYYEFGI